MDKQKLQIMLMALVLMVSCQSKPKSTETNKEVIGGNKDEHGCVTSAGYVWSEIKKDCIRPFAIGTQLTAVDTTWSSFASYIVTNSDTTQVELFSPITPKAIILDKSETGVWKPKNKVPMITSVTYKDEVWKVMNENKILFEGQKK